MKQNQRSVFAFGLAAISLLISSPAFAGTLFNCIVVNDYPGNPLDEGLSTTDSDYRMVYAENTQLAKLGGFWVRKAEGDTIRVLRKTRQVLQALIMRKVWGADQYFVTVNYDRSAGRGRYWGSVDFRPNPTARTIRIAGLVCL